MAVSGSEFCTRLRTLKLVILYVFAYIGYVDSALKSRADAVPTPGRKLLMNTISVTDARNRLPELVDDVSGHLSEYVITRHGRAHAVLLSVEEHEALLDTLEILSDSRTMERVRNGLDELARGDVVSFEDVFGEPL